MAAVANGNGGAATKTERAVAAALAYREGHGRLPARQRLAELADCSTGTAQKVLADLNAKDV